MEKMKKTVEELKEKSQKALENPGLVEIVKRAPLNRDGKVNLSWIYREAEKYVHEQTKDLQKTKELAEETRFLGMLRRDYEEEFEKLFVEEEAMESENEIKGPIRLEDIEFELPLLAEIVLGIKNRLFGGERPKCAVRFAADRMPGLDEQCLYIELEKFLIKVLRAFSQTAMFGSTKREPFYDEEKMVYQDLRDCFIQILEEKFGLKVKVCGNCKHYHENSTIGREVGRGVCKRLFIEEAVKSFGHPYDVDAWAIDEMNDICKSWAQKEVLEK